MIKESFHKNWMVAKIFPGILGMDIMGYPGGIYRYTKRFQVPKEWQNKTVSVEFEGSYGHTMVYLNGDTSY